MLALHEIFIILHSITLLMEKYTPTCLYRVKLGLEKQIYLFAVHMNVYIQIRKKRRHINLKVLNPEYFKT